MTETPQSEDPDPTEMYCLDNAGGISTGREGPVFETKSIFCLALGVGGMPWSWFTAQGDTANMNNHLHFWDSSLRNKETVLDMKDQGSSFSIPTGSFYCPLLAEPSKAPTGKAKQKGVYSSSNQCEAESPCPKKQDAGVVTEGTHPSAAQPMEDGQPGPPLSLDIASPVFTQVFPDLWSNGPECRSTFCTNK